MTLCNVHRFVVLRCVFLPMHFTLISLNKFLQIRNNCVLKMYFCIKMNHGYKFITYMYKIGAVTKQYTLCECITIHVPLLILYCNNALFIC